MLLPLLGVLLAASAPGAAAPPGPPGPAPLVVVVMADDSGRGFIEMLVTTSRREKRTVSVQVGGRVENRVVEVIVPVTMKKRVSLDDQAVTVYDTGGKKIPPAQLPKLKGATPALLSANGQAVDAFFLRVARPGTLVIVAPGLASVPAAPAPVPRPIPNVPSGPVPKGL